MVYERHKDAPPIARNASPVAGNIVWARQLLRRIEAPMVRFKQSAQLMSTCASRSNEWPASGAHSARPEPCGLADADGAFSHRARARRKESKKIVKTYNRCVAIPRGPDGMPSQHRPAASPRLLGFGWRAAFAPPPAPPDHHPQIAPLLTMWRVACAHPCRPHMLRRIARTIVEFETLWHLAWQKSIDASKAGLQATLLIRHPKSNAYLVNFDREILLLIRETRCLLRLGVPIPDSARLVLMQVRTRSSTRSAHPCSRGRWSCERAWARIHSVACGSRPWVCARASAVHACAAPSHATALTLACSRRRFRLSRSWAGAQVQVVLQPAHVRPRAVRRDPRTRDAGARASAAPPPTRL